MISGTVTADREAVLRFPVYDSQGRPQDTNAVVDTGFTGFLTLPIAIITALGLARVSRGRAVLANISEEVFDIYAVQILWDGQPRLVEVDAAETGPLVGMSLLYGYELRLRVMDGGDLTLTALP